MFPFPQNSNTRSWCATVSWRIALKPAGWRSICVKWSNIGRKSIGRTSVTTEAQYPTRWSPSMWKMNSRIHWRQAYSSSRPTVRHVSVWCSAFNSLTKSILKHKIFRNENSLRRLHEFTALWHDDIDVDTKIENHMRLPLMAARADF